MVKDGDRILVCLSGGKDSLSLLHTMHQYQCYAKSHGVSFELGAITIDPGSPSYDPSSLIGYLEGLNTTYLYEEQSKVILFKFYYTTSKIVILSMMTCHGKQFF